MASDRELIQLSNEGDLGNLIAETFQGRLGHADGRLDADRVITFESDANTPTSRQIHALVLQHYKTLGYDIELEMEGFNMCVGSVRKFDSMNGLITMTISTNYPLDGTCNHVRVTTDALF
jgi:hypothetical protein